MAAWESLAFAPHISFAQSKTITKHTDAFANISYIYSIPVWLCRHEDDSKDERAKTNRLEFWSFWISWWILCLVCRSTKIRRLRQPLAFPPNSRWWMHPSPLARSSYICSEAVQPTCCSFCSHFRVFERRLVCLVANRAINRHRRFHTVQIRCSLSLRTKNGWEKFAKNFISDGYCDKNF